ncbi:MAG: response regulator [Proteobacteria bacterium]|nr:response regulator [Pseudomonadota bacterium]MBU1965686.1 response regulator [Pseudomonadota bacterium]
MILYNKPTAFLKEYKIFSKLPKIMNSIQKTGVSEYKDSEAPLRALSKNAFLSQMGHDLRTSIMGIIGYSEMLIEDAESEGFKEFLLDLKEIHKAGNQLLTFVNDMFDLKKTAVQTVSDMEKFNAKIRSITLAPITVIKGYAGILIDEMEQKNSIKFIPDLKMIVTAVERFVTSVNNFPHTWHDKTDMNLTYQDRNIMNQEIITSISNLSEETLIQKSTVGGAILIVDDSKQNRDLLTRRLERDGHTVSVAETGREALRMLGCNSFDLVLLDIMMPEINGYQVLRHLKSDDNISHIPVIMLSALEEIDHVVRCIEMGAEDYLHKPFDPVLLRARIGACLEKKRLRDREHAYIHQLRAEREKSERLLLNILPSPIAGRLKRGENPIVDNFPDVTVLFADIVGFTQLSAQIIASELIGALNEIFTIFDELAEQHDLEKIKTIGDSYMVVGGLPTPRSDHAEAVARMALDMLKGIAKINSRKGQALSLRIGIHTGPVIAGVIGTRKFIYDLWGDTVNIASRMESHGLPDCIQVTETTQALLSGKFVFEKRGLIEVKGKGKMITYFLKDRI